MRKKLEKSWNKVENSCRSLLRERGGMLGREERSRRRKRRRRNEKKEKKKKQRVNTIAKVRDK